jgi:hypothetical protein
LGSPTSIGGTLTVGGEARIPQQACRGLVAVPGGAGPGSTRRLGDRAAARRRAQGRLGIGPGELTARGIKLKPKDDIRERIGRPPGKGYAVVMAWAEGAKAVKRLLRGNRPPEKASAAERDRANQNPIRSESRARLVEGIAKARFQRLRPGRSLIGGRDRRIRARYFLARNGGGRRSSENTFKLSDYFLQFGVYVASVASLVLKVIAQCAQSPDHTSQCLHWCPLHRYGGATPV